MTQELGNTYRQAYFTPWYWLHPANTDRYYCSKPGTCTGIVEAVFKDALKNIVMYCDYLPSCGH